MHPDVLDTQFHTLPDDLLAHSGAGKDEDGVGFLRQGLQIRVARIAIIYDDVRADSEYLITSRLKLLIIQVTTGLAFIGYSDHGDLLLRQEVMNKGVDFCHEDYPDVKS